MEDDEDDDVCEPDASTVEVGRVRIRLAVGHADVHGGVWRTRQWTATEIRR